MLGASLSNHQTDALIELIQRCVSDPTSFTLSSSKGVRESWDAARTVHNTSKVRLQKIVIYYCKDN